MIRVETWIRPHQIHAMKVALRDSGASGFTASDVSVLSAEAGVPSRVCVKLEAIVHDDRIERLLAELARAGRPVGTGEIWLVRVVRAVRIGSGAIDEAAIA